MNKDFASFKETKHPCKIEIVEKKKLFQDINKFDKKLQKQLVKEWLYG